MKDKKVDFPIVEVDEPNSDSPCIIESPANLFDLVEEVIRNKKSPDQY